MPSPESPANRMTTWSSPWTGRSAVSVTVFQATAAQGDGHLMETPVPPNRDDLRRTCFEDAADRGVEGLVELLVALLGREPLREGPGEAGDHALVAGQPGVGLFPRVAAGQGDHLEDVRV